jgi:hypothetical protein
MQKGGNMERYLIETPHTGDNCLALVDQVQAQGYLHHFDWGCRAGVHTGWVIIDAENENQARMAVPPLVRHQARVIRLNKFSEAEVAELHNPAPAHSKAT